jgi:tetratricopeptide (TPR) repeat protein
MPRSSSTLLRSSCILLVIVCGLFVANGQPSGASLSQIESLIRARQFDQALQATHTRLRQVPGDFRVWTMQAIIYSVKGKNVEALASYDKALALSPNYIPALKGAVQLLYQSGDQRAIPMLERILKAEPSDQTAHEMLALMQQKQGHCQESVDQFQLVGTAINSHPASLEAYGYCLAQLQQFQKAIPVFEQLVELLPNQTNPKYNLAVLLVSTKQNDAALKVLTPLLTDDQKDPDILSLASQAYEAVGETPKAVALLREAIVLSPTTTNYYVAFAALCMDHDSFQVGIDMVNVGLHHIPNDPSLYLSRGLLYAQLAEYDKADADFKKVEQLDTKQSLSSYALDLTDLQKNNPAQALTRVRTQLKQFPSSPLLNLLLAELLMNQSPPAGSPVYLEAKKAALLAVKLKPDLVKARDLLADMYMRSNQYDQAIEQCRLALQYSPSDETAMYHLIISLRHTGKRDELAPLVKRLAEMHQESLHQETGRKKFRLVEQEHPPQNQTNAP